MSDETTPENTKPDAFEALFKAEPASEETSGDEDAPVVADAPADEVEATPATSPAEPSPEPARAASDEAKGAPVATAGDEFEIEEEPLVVPPPDDGVKRRWYAIHAHSGQEGNVRRSLLAQVEQQNMQADITNVLVPMEEVAEFRSGEQKVSKRKFFPGYVLVQLPEHPETHPDLWHIIKETHGVTGFIGSRTVPVPLEDSEIDSILEEIRGERERPRQKILFEVSERVKIIDGPFSNFLGNIDEINDDRGKLKVMVEIFERLTSVEVEYWQVEKV